MNASYNSKAEDSSLELTYLQSGRMQFWVSSFVNIALIFAFGSLSKLVVSAFGGELISFDYSGLLLGAAPCVWVVNALISKFNFSFKVTLPKVIELNSLCQQLELDVECALFKIRQMKLSIFISQSRLSPDNQDNVSVRNIFIFHRQIFHNPSFLEKVRSNQVCLDYRQALSLLEEYKERQKQKEATVAKPYQDEICLLKEYRADADYKNAKLQSKLDEADRIKSQLVADISLIHKIRQDIVCLAEKLDEPVKGERKSTKTQNETKVINALIISHLCMPTFEDILMNHSDKTTLYRHDLHKIFLSGLSNNDFIYRLCQKYMPSKIALYDDYLRTRLEAEKNGSLDNQIKYGALKEPLLIPTPIHNALWEIAQELGIAAAPGHP